MEDVLLRLRATSSEQHIKGVKTNHAPVILRRKGSKLIARSSQPVHQRLAFEELPHYHLRFPACIFQVIVEDGAVEMIFERKFIRGFADPCF
jgi:hypothetical protein